MDLNNVSTISNLFNEAVLRGDLKREQLNDIQIMIQASPSNIYAFDRELYRLSHGGTTEGFQHTDKVQAKIDGVTFVFEPKLTD